jgi:hypothetical protein
MIECLDLEELLQPWLIDSRHLISWFDMLQFSARGFFWLSQYLENLKSECLILSIPVDGDTPLFDI